MQISIIVSYFLIITTISSSTLLTQNKTLPVKTGSVSINELPKEWRECCSIQTYGGSNATNLYCIIKSGTTLDIRSLRNLQWTMKMNLNVSFQCDDGGNLFLPMPVKVPSIVSLSVDNCNLIGSNSESFDENIAKLQDRIRYSKITNSVRIIDDSYLKIMIQSVTNHYTDSTECGQLNAEVLIERNVTTNFINSESFNILFSKNMGKIARSSTVIKSICIYKNLKIYDNSRNPTLGMNPIGSLLQSSSFPNLEVMNLSRVNLNEIPHHLRKWRLYFPRMNYLDLSHNNLGEVNSVVDIGHKDENETIGVIDLRHNRIKMLTKQNLESFLRHMFVKVDVRDNPFECDCRMNTVKTFLTRFGQKLPKQYDYLYGLRCTSPKKFKGRRMINLSMEEFGCKKSSKRLETNTMIILLTFSGVFLIVIIFMIAFRKEIPVLFYTRIYIHITCCAQNVQDDKNFDAFVAFSEDNQDWVIRTLIPSLEGPEKQPSFKFCIHQRDFLLGSTIVDNILSCVKESRHFIFIISKAFVRSEWCLMEFRAALQQSLREKTDSLVMVLYEDISDMEIDEDLKRCLKTVTYVKIDDRLFWDKIVYALSRKQKRARRQIFHIEDVEMRMQARI